MFDPYIQDSLNILFLVQCLIFVTFYLQKLYQRPNGENTSQVYRSQLAASLRAFQPKEWPSLNHQELNPTFFRCRPVQPTTERWAVVVVVVVVE